MLLPSNAQKLQTISEIFKDGMEALCAKGASYYDERAEQLAAQAIRSCMPELATFAQSRITAEALQGISLGDDEAQPFDGVHVGGAVLQRVSIQKIIEQVQIDGLEFETSTHDLCLVMVPTYLDPDPKDIVFGHELYVPFGTVVHFEPAA